MEGILYLVIGAIVGTVIGYLILKVNQQRAYVPKTEFETLQKEILQLQVEIVSRIPKDEITARYVTKELYNNVAQNLEEAKVGFENEVAANKDHQTTILRFTSESEQKLSKAELERNYVANETVIIDTANGTDITDVTIINN